MYICIVSGCRNGNNNLVTLHQFPADPIIKEAWLRKIGGNSQPKKCARVCSMHFSDECFVRPITKKNKQSGRFRRKLIPNAVPTLHLTSAGNTDKRKFGIIRRNFPLRVLHKSKDKGIIDINKCSTLSQPDIIDQTISDVSTDPLNITASDVNIEPPTVVESRRNPWLDGRYKRYHTPPRETNPLVAKRCKSEPRISGQLRQTRKTTSFKKEKSKMKSRGTVRIEMECHSLDGSPLHKRRESFFNENCLGNDQHKHLGNREKDDPRIQIQVLTELVQHYRSLAHFHMQSSRTSMEVENEALKLQLRQANAEMERLRAENQNLMSTLHDLQLKVESPDQIQDLLKRYFTETQIRHILKAKLCYLSFS